MLMWWVGFKAILLFVRIDPFVFRRYPSLTAIAIGMQTRVAVAPSLRPLYIDLFYRSSLDGRSHFVPQFLIDILGGLFLLSQTDAP